MLLMSGFFINIEKETKENSFFRKVLFTANKSQLVVMALKPSEEIGFEIHPENDQFFRFEEGSGKVIVGTDEFIVGPTDVVIVPSGENHNVINTSTLKYLKLYTIYSPAHHPDGTIHKTKEEALQAE
jgi:mannose-6-phosphate isomerase-like protein (cupin superfamily)